MFSGGIINIWGLFTDEVVTFSAPLVVARGNIIIIAIWSTSLVSFTPSPFTRHSLLVQLWINDIGKFQLKFIFIEKNRNF